MAAGIRPNSALAEASGLHCDRGIVVSDTLQTYDPRIYAVGECVSHRGIAYGLVAPLFEQAKVCANHLALMGINRYGIALALNFPRISDGRWFLAQYRRWRLWRGDSNEAANDAAIASAINQTALYREAAALAEVPIPGETRTDVLCDGATWC
ncbi:MAG: nitrite reductase large subunit [Paraburkholderia sp.]|jgi:NADPH-dependent 2,4-dienoyl-CoA reductase/sulfur reductase-like enzyme|nr:nitrite reductase large subunit [Paraburkholderia sp.]